MKIETIIQEDHQAKLIVEVDADIMEGAKQRAARKLASRVKIPGFRPGKAPYNVIVKQLGDAQILEQAIELVVDEIYPKILDETKIEPYGPGKLENMPSIEPLTLEFLVPLQAQVILGDYRSISKPYELHHVTEQEIDDVLGNLRDRQAIIEPVERPAQEGDVVTIILSAERTQIEEGQSPTLIRSHSTPITIQSLVDPVEDENHEEHEEWPFRGFSRHLLGASSGDTKEIVYTYPDDSTFENLRGVAANFSITVENVKSRTLPDLDDDFAQLIGEFASLDALREEIRRSLQQQSDQSYNDDYDDGVLEEIVNLSEVKYPAQMVEHEIEDVIESLKNRLSQQNMDMDLYLKSRQIDIAALREEARPVAETRIRKSLVLMEVAKSEKIEVEPHELQSETVSAMNALSGRLSQKEARRLKDRNVVQNLMGNVMADLLNRKTIERLRVIAGGVVVDQPVSRGTEEELLSVADEIIEGETASENSESLE